MIDFDVTRAFVRNMLEHWYRYEWTLQGFGMLRAYLSKDLRVHIWSGPHQVPDVTLLHDHPWDFTSLIVSGRIMNHRWTPEIPGAAGSTRFLCSKIVCGPGGCALPGAEPVWLSRQTAEEYTAGDWYSQQRSEIHSTGFDSGTVTIIKRRFYEDTEHAHVFYENDWVSAEPRRATADEIGAIVAVAIENWETT